MLFFPERWHLARPDFYCDQSNLIKKTCSSSLDVRCSACSIFIAYLVRFRHMICRHILLVCLFEGVLS